MAPRTPMTTSPSTHSGEPKRPSAALRPGVWLTALERPRLALEIVAAYIRARLALRRAPIEQVVASLRPLDVQSAPASRHTLQQAHRLGWVVSRTLRPLPGDTRCLTQSLVLIQLLARRGISARLVIGARAAPEFLAHAWVEHGREPVLKPGDETFGRLVEL
jgi:hypothetical protein